MTVHPPNPNRNICAGAAATTVEGVEASAQLGAKRSSAACQQRYQQLCAAAAACGAGAGGLAASDGRENLDALLAQLRLRLQRQLRLSSAGTKTLAVVQQMLQRSAGGGPQAAALAAQLQQHLATLLPGAAPAADPGLLAPSAAAPLAQAQQLTAAVQQRCGSSAVQAITSRLHHIMEAGGSALVEGGVL